MPLTSETIKAIAARAAERVLEYTDTPSTNAPHYIFRIEIEPLLPQGKKYVAYYPDGTPRYLGAATAEELIARIRQNESQATYEIEVLPSVTREDKSPETPREQSLRLEGEEIACQLDNGVNYRGPWLPDGPDGEFFGHLFQDDAVTQSSFACKDIEDCKANLIRLRKNWEVKPPVFLSGPAPFKTTTDLPFYDAFLKDPAYAKSKGYQVKIVDMSPDDYISQVAQMQGTDITRQIQMVQQDLVDKYAGMMKSGVKFDLPHLDFKRQEQEGRARALAAKQLGYSMIPVLIAREVEPPVFTIQEKVNPCPNLQPMSEWIKGETPGTCRPCVLTPVVQWYWQELKERGLEDIAAQLEAEVDVLEEDNVEQVMALCKDLDEIKASAPADLRKRLEEFDCAIQSFEPDEASDEVQPGD